MGMSELGQLRAHQSWLRLDNQRHSHIIHQSSSQAADPFGAPLTSRVTASPTLGKPKELEPSCCQGGWR